MSHNSARSGIMPRPFRVALSVAFGGAAPWFPGTIGSDCGSGTSSGAHAEVFLRPVLVELGASCPASGLYLLETEYMKPEASAAWLETARAHL